jgi:hypothetical protein
MCSAFVTLGFECRAITPRICPWAFMEIARLISIVPDCDDGDPTALGEHALTFARFCWRASRRQHQRPRPSVICIAGRGENRPACDRAVARALIGTSLPAFFGAHRCDDANAREATASSTLCNSNATVARNESRFTRERFRAMKQRMYGRCNTAH